MTSGTNQPETWSARRWIGARLRCACATICTICASTVSRPILSARITKAPLWFIVPPITLSPATLADRHRFSGQHGFVDRASPFDDLAVHRDLLARPNAQAVADLDRIERDLLVRPFLHGRAARSLAQIDERADRAASLFARPELEHLSEQDKGGDDRRRFEIDGHRAMVAAERGRKQAGATVATTL